MQKINVIIQRLHRCAFHPSPPTGKAVNSDYAVYRKSDKLGICFTVLFQKEIFVPFYLNLSKRSIFLSFVQFCFYMLYLMYRTFNLSKECLFQNSVRKRLCFFDR